MPPFVPSAGVGTLNVALSNYMKQLMTGSPVCRQLAPTVPVGQRSFQYLMLGKENRRRVPTTRTPGGRPRETRMSYSTDTYACVSHALSAAITREAGDAAALLNWNAKQGAIKQIMDQITMDRECTVRDLITANATNADTYTTGTTQWNDYSGTSTPIEDVKVARRTIHKAAGVNPNVLIAGPDTIDALSNHPEIIERFKYTNTTGNVSLQQIAQALNVAQVVEADLVQDDGANNDSWVWAQLAVLAYVQPVSSQEDVSALKTFVLNSGDGSGVDGYEVMEFPDPYIDAKTDWVSAECEYDIKLTAQESLFVFKNVVAAS